MSRPRGQGSPASGPIEKPGADQEGSLAIAHHRISQWAEAELSEVRKVWFKPASLGYQDWEPERDPESRVNREIIRHTREWSEIQLAGWVIYTLKERNRNAIRRLYIDGKRVGPHARRLALSEFARRWKEWEFVWHPLDPL